MIRPEDDQDNAQSNRTSFNIVINNDKHLQLE